MGAAPIISAAPLLQQKGYTVAGVGILDVVEGECEFAHIASAVQSCDQLTPGTAVESLPLMKSILSKRPTSFNSVSDAIGWQ